MTCNQVAPAADWHWALYSLGKVTHGVVTVVPGTLVPAARKYGCSEPIPREKVTGLTQATC